MPTTTTRQRPLMGLQARAEAEAADKHARRRTELQAFAPLLLQLDQHMPGLRALGLDLQPDDINLLHEHIGNRRTKVLRAYTGGAFNDIKRTCEWLEALKALGFTEVSRTDSAYPSALLRRGALLIRVDVLRAPPATVQPASHGPSVRQCINNMLAEAAA